MATLIVMFVMSLMAGIMLVICALRTSEAEVREEFLHQRISLNVPPMRQQKVEAWFVEVAR